MEKRASQCRRPLFLRFVSVPRRWGIGLRWLTLCAGVGHNSRESRVAVKRTTLTLILSLKGEEIRGDGFRLRGNDGYSKVSSREKG